MAAELERTDPGEMRNTLEDILSTYDEDDPANEPPRGVRRPRGTGAAASDLEEATRDLSRMSFATGGLAASVAGGSFWECGHTMAFGK